MTVCNQTTLQPFRAQTAFERKQRSSIRAIKKGDSPIRISLLALALPTVHPCPPPTHIMKQSDSEGRDNLSVCVCVCELKGPVCSTRLTPVTLDLIVCR